jgi:hypothetical protein
MTLQLLHSEFPYIWGKFDFLFYQFVRAIKLRNLSGTCWLHWKKALQPNYYYCQLFSNYFIFYYCTCYFLYNILLCLFHIHATLIPNLQYMWTHKTRFTSTSIAQRGIKVYKYLSLINTINTLKSDSSFVLYLNGNLVVQKRWMCGDQEQILQCEGLPGCLCRREYPQLRLASSTLASKLSPC